MSLSSAALAKAKPGDILHDADVHGLHVRVAARGASFMLFYRTKDGRQRRPKIGDAGVMTITQARARAREMLLAVSRGEDPSGGIIAARKAATFADLKKRYLEEHAADLKSKSSIERMLDVDLSPRFDGRKVASFDGDDIDALRKAMRDRPVHFNRVRALLSKMFNLAEKWKMRPKGSNPVIGVARYPEHKRRRYMKAEEATAIARMLDAEEAANPASVAFLRLLILTGARCGEIATARWEWLDGAVLRHPNVKTGERDIYLSSAALAVVERLPRTSGTLTGIQSPKKLWDKIRHAAGCPDLRMHDLRHSFASVALSLGMTLGQIGELLGHASTQTTQRYAHLIEEHKQAAAARTAEAITRRMLPQGETPCSFEGCSPSLASAQ